MAITPKEIVSSVRTKFKLWDSDGYANFSDLLLTHLMNEAQNALVNSLVDDVLLEKFKTASNQGTAGSASLPTDMVRLLSVWVNGVPTAILKHDEYRKTQDDAFGNGTEDSPLCWFDNEKLYYAPESADLIVTFKYIPEFAAMALPTTSSTLPDTFHYLLELYVMSKVAERLNQGSESISYLNKFNGEINKINAQAIGQTNAVEIKNG